MISWTLISYMVELGAIQCFQFDYKTTKTIWRLILCCSTNVFLYFDLHYCVHSFVCSTRLVSIPSTLRSSFYSLKSDLELWSQVSSHMLLLCAHTRSASTYAWIIEHYKHHYSSWIIQHVSLLKGTTHIKYTAKQTQAKALMWLWSFYNGSLIVDVYIKGQLSHHTNCGGQLWRANYWRVSEGDFSEGGGESHQSFLKLQTDIR